MPFLTTPRRNWFLRFIGAAAIYTLIGGGASMLLAIVLSGLIDPRAAVPTSAEAFDGEAKWTASVWSRPGAVYIESTRNTGGSWSPWQATGAPNTLNAGDASTAWATQQQDAPGEWLELLYASAVVPKAIHVYENYAPGAVVRVTAFNADGVEDEAWRGADPTPTTRPSGVSKIPISVTSPTRRIRVYLDSAAVPNWNEIDAVGLVDINDTIQWAIRAKASSYYGGGESDPQAAAVHALFPRWSGLDEPGPGFSSGKANQEAIAVAAYGWPLFVLAGSQDVLATAQTFPPPSLADPFTSSTVLPVSGPRTSFSISTYKPLGRPIPPAGAPVGPPPGPRRILWLGLAASAAVYGVVLYLLRLGVVWPARFVSEVSRLRRGRCIACGYDLGYDFVRGCPECGWRRGETGASPQDQVA